MKVKRKHIWKKRYTKSVLGILLPVLVLLIVMNTGYSLWSSKLNIRTKVSLDYKAPALDIVVPKQDSGQYVATTGFVNATGTTTFDLISEEYYSNSLVTTIKVHQEDGIALHASNITVGFIMKNTSNEGHLYTNGKTEQTESSYSKNAITKISATVSPTTISSGDSAEFKISARINSRNLQDATYFKYTITYEVDGVTKYFYYTLKILPPD